MSVENNIENIFNTHHVDYDGPISFGATYFDFILGGIKYELLHNEVNLVISELTPTIASSNIYKTVYAGSLESFSDWLINQIMDNSCR